MLVRVLIALSIVFGLTVANPVEDNSDVEYAGDDFSSELLKTQTSAIVLNVLTKLVGFKVSAVSIAVVVIKWLVSNSLILAFGAIATLAFCKLTDKCNLHYIDYGNVAPVAQFRSFVTPENLETAENFLVTAIEKYAQEG